jgi:hypothetical protein
MLRAAAEDIGRHKAGACLQIQPDRICNLITRSRITLHLLDLDAKRNGYQYSVLGDSDGKAAWILKESGDLLPGMYVCKYGCMYVRLFLCMYVCM